MKENLVWDRFKPSFATNLGASQPDWCILSNASYGLHVVPLLPPGIGEVRQKGWLQRLSSQPRHASSLPSTLLTPKAEQVTFLLYKPLLLVRGYTEHRNTAPPVRAGEGAQRWELPAAIVCCHSSVLLWLVTRRVRTSSEWDWAGLRWMGA